MRGARPARAARLVRVLADEALEEGAHIVGWNGRDTFGRPVGSGTYFMRLETGSSSVTRKLVRID